MHRLLRVVLASSCLIGVVAAATPAPACDCGGLELAQALARADAVFEGQVTDVAPNRVATLAVGRAFKGAPGTRAVVGGGGSSCDYAFAKGERYLVFARAGQGGTWTTSICTRTAKVTDPSAKKDLAALSK
jgi:hypothetical protein